MKKALHILFCLSLLVLSACNVHEWPETKNLVQFKLRLNFDTEITEWEHHWDEEEVVEQGIGDTYDSYRTYGKMRYVIRAYPVAPQQRSSRSHTEEFVFTKNIAEGYDHEFTLDLPAGSYNVMVWADMNETSEDQPFYNVENFAEISIQGEHVGNTDFRDAFRGTGEITLTADYHERPAEILEVTMQRPMAKFEFITSDVVEFIKKEALRIAQKSNAEKSELSNEEAPSRSVNIEDYKVVFYFKYYMPTSYSLFTDKLADSTTGVAFASTLKRLTNSEASMGFDYVFVNDKQSLVTVQLGVYDDEGTQLSLTQQIEVPIKRNYHTIMTGEFLMSETSGGVTINPDYDGDYNLIM